MDKPHVLGLMIFLISTLGTAQPAQSTKPLEKLWISQVRYQDAKTQAYISSPSLLRLADGALLAIHDFFGPGAPLNQEGEEILTAVYRSEDNGLTWKSITYLSYTLWGSLFEHRGSAICLRMRPMMGISSFANLMMAAIGGQRPLMIKAVCCSRLDQNVYRQITAAPQCRC